MIFQASARLTLKKAGLLRAHTKFLLKIFYKGLGIRVLAGFVFCVVTWSRDCSSVGSGS